MADGERITIMDVFEARRRAQGKALGGAYTAQEFEAVGLSMLGGCSGCGEQLAAYNAYPAVNGFWSCQGCLVEGYATVEDFEADWGPGL